jgi:ADP-ribose diphosphatase
MLRLGLYFSRSAMAFELIHSEKVFSGRAFSIRRDRVSLPDGRQVNLDIVEHVGSVVILPIDADGDILFVRQYRHAVARDLLELPAGTLEPGEDPQACALRELREETGMSAGEMKLLGGFFLAPGYSTEYMHAYMAANLRLSPLHGDPDEFLSVEKIPARDVLNASNLDILQDAKSLAAFHLARHVLEMYR